MDLEALLADLARLEEGAWSDRLLLASHRRGGRRGPDRARHTAVLRRALEEWRRHDWVLDARLRRPPRPRLKAALRLGLVLLEEQRPAHAVLDGLLRALEGLSAAERGLLNAVLRGLLRDPQPLAPLPGPGDRAGLATAFSLPPWFLDLLERLEGPDVLTPRCLHRLRGELFRGRGLWLRVNLSRWTPEEARRDLEERGLRPEAAPETPLFLRLGRPPAAGLEELPPLADGRLRVQDLSAWGALALLDPAPGDRVLDLCAAPGGKALALLDLVPGLDLTVVEAHPGRARSLARRLEGRARLVAGDARGVAGEGWTRVLLDVPCSGSGTVGHRPDILRKEDPVTPELLALQASLLAHAADILAPGGRLVYSTCSLDPRENSGQTALAAARGLRVRADLVPVDRREAGGWAWRPWSGAGRGPHRPGAGGAWAVALEKPD